MFSHQSDATKIALSALVAWALKHQIGMIDCQQATAHLMSMGAHTIERADFVQHVAQAVQSPAAPWVFGSDDWSFLY
jgi:leucyl/phenylalanyl-tRNA--protein transferase